MDWTSWGILGLLAAALVIAGVILIILMAIFKKKTVFHDPLSGEVPTDPGGGGFDSGGCGGSDD